MGLLTKVADAVLGLAAQTQAESSNWGSIHPDLIATFVQIDAKEKPTGVAFKALVKEGSVEQQFNWGSPFEGMNVESQHLSLKGHSISGAFVSGAVQVGALGGLAQLLGIGGEQNAEDKAAWLSAGEALAGKTGITKLNSRQVFTGHAPLKVSMTLLFRAWQDPQSEVAAPFQTLLKMAYPPKLAENLIAAAKEEQGAAALVAALFPSDAPQRVRMTYKGETYPAMVIESISKPLDAPYSPMGDLWLEVQVTLESYQSLDYQDIQNAGKGVLGNLLSEAIDSKCTFLKPKDGK